MVMACYACMLVGLDHLYVSLFYKHDKKSSKVQIKRGMSPTLLLVVIKLRSPSNKQSNCGA